MKAFWSGCVAAGVVLAGCTSVSTEGTQFSIKEVSQALASRTINMHVAGPIDLAKGGKILNDAGGGILTDAGAGILTDAGAGVVAAGGLNFRVKAASTASFSNVDKAHVQLFTLDGKKEGKHAEAGADGMVKVKAKDGKPLLAVAMFKVDGKTYRVATILAAGKIAETVEIDPINTMVEARVRQIVGTNDKNTALTGTKLKRVWTICNNAGITVAPADLEATKTPQEMLDRLTAVWKEAIDSKVTNQAEKDELKSFMADVTAATK